MKTWELVAMILAGVGALNWGLVGLFSFNLVEFLLGWMPALIKWVYVLVGISGGYALFKAFK